MPDHNLLTLVANTRQWRRALLVLAIATICLGAFTFIAWEFSHMSNDVQRTTNSLDAWVKGIVTEKIHAPGTEFIVNSQGQIIVGQPAWVETLDISESALWNRLQQTGWAKLQLIPGKDIATQQASVYTVQSHDSSYRITSLPFDLLVKQDDSYLTMILGPDSKVQLSTLPEMAGYQLNRFGLLLYGGKIFLAVSGPQLSGQELNFVTFSDISLPVGITVLVITVFFGGMMAIDAQSKSTVSGLQTIHSELLRIELAARKCSEERLYKANLDDAFEELERADFSFPESRDLSRILKRIFRHCQNLSLLLEEKEQQFSLLTGLSPVGIYLANSEANITYVNQRMCEILNTPQQHIIGSPFSNFIHPDDKKKRRLTESHQIDYQEPVRLIRRDKREIYAYCEEAIQFNEDEVEIGSIGAVTDVTTIKQTQWSLQKLEARWQFALEGSGNGVWDWNIATGQTYFSPQWCALIGYDKQELTDHVREWTNRIHPDDAIESRSEIDRHLSGETSHYEREHRLLCKNGEYKWMLDRGKVIEWDASGKPARMIGTHADISDRKLHEAHIQHLAYHDSLTDLPNRVFLQEELQYLLAQLKRNQQHSALLFLDIDHFKMVNDSMGHSVGDEMLRQIADRLKKNTRDGDFLARLGGDEFVIVLGNPTDDIERVYQRAQAVAANILTSFKQPFDLNRQSVVRGTSIGIVTLPTDGNTVSKILQHADTAMYEAKKSGRNTLHFYQKEMATAIKRRLFVENALRSAIENNELSLFYQPKVNIEELSVIGAEALLRWNHKGESISPAEFIPIAEDSGLIVHLGDWIMRVACEQIKTWKQHPAFKSLQHLAINVSPLQFGQADFTEKTLAILKKTGISPNWLEFELTEGVFMGDLAKSKSKMEQLKQHGIRFAVDDFGTGYSSLAYLKQLPLDVLKVDQTFVRDCTTDANDASIVRTVLAMACGLGMEAVAEGVESEDHVDFLRSEGCQYFQGYYFSRPLNAKAFENLIIAKRISSRR
ncbi:MAG: hypothetical protein CSA50_05065 [Gammaproteobacteria bacterium]|nr:MAG: hypothetical protein CSA50_05065 [Gammaproteobacteria bacterium]